jgi:acyl carrier protein
MNEVLLRRLNEAGAADRRTILLDHLVETVKSILGPGASASPGAQQKLFETGLKSIDLITLKDRLESDFSIELPVTLFFAYSTLGGLAEHLSSDLLRAGPGESRRREAPQPDASVAAPADSALLARLEEMSEEEAERGLLDRIADLEKRSR